MTMIGIQKKIAYKFMQEAIKHHIKKEYIKKGVHPTVEQVIQDINPENLATLLNHYTEDEIKGVVDSILRRQKK